MELDIIETNLIDATENVTRLQTVIDQLDERAASARTLLEGQTIRSIRNKANSVLSQCEAERIKLAHQLQAAKSRLKDVQTKKENFNFPALQEEQRLKKLVRNLAS